MRAKSFLYYTERGRLLLLAAAMVVHAWDLQAQEKRGEWTGTWQTHWRGGGALLRLRQSGNEITGTYSLYDGTVEGAVRARRLEGIWKEASGRNGKFFFVLAPDGETFTGRFGSGEWWTGTRLSGLPDYVARLVVLTSPRETLRSFLEAANATRGGFIERIQPALETIDFSKMKSERLAGGALLPQEKIDYARELFHVLDELTFRIWSLSLASDLETFRENSVVVTLPQEGTTNTFDLPLRREGEKWLIDPPSREELRAALTRLYAGRGGQPPTEDEHLGLHNPRDTIRTFIEAMNQLDEGGRARALRTLDLGSFSTVVQAEDAELLIQYLKRVLDLIGLVVYQEIPNDPGRRSPYVHFKHGAGNVVIAPYTLADGKTEWRFTGETLHSVRALYAAMEDMPRVSGILGLEESWSYFRVRDLLRGSLPVLLRPLGPLEIWQWLSLLLFLVTSGLLALVFTALVLWLLRRRRSWAAAFSSRRSQRAVTWPLRCTFIGLFWYLKIGALGLPELAGASFRHVAGTVAINGAVWLAYRGAGLAGALTRRTLGVTGQRSVLTSLSFGIIRIVIIIIGVLLLADIWSVPYSSVLAGLGIGGLAFALAAQPTLQNMIAGFTLYADSPLSVGDFCRYGDKVGTVEEVGLRSTRVRSLERSVVTIPNSEFANLQLENLTKRDRRLLKSILQLRYETTPDQLRFVLAELRRLLIAHPRIHADPARVRFTGFGAHSLDLEIFAYVLTADHNEYLAVQEDIFLRMMQIVLKSGTGFAFPSQVNYLARDTGLDDKLTKEAEQAVAAWRTGSRLPFPDFPASEVRQLEGQLDYPPKGSADREEKEET